jgi:argininosuccinate lyase
MKPMKPLRSRFTTDADKLVQDYTESISFDHRLYRHDIAGSTAHARMLAKQGIIGEKEAESIISGLISIQEEIEQGKFEFKPELEDIHMHIESRLLEKIGDVAGKLHTARSRNDQVALDLRLYTKEAIGLTISQLRSGQRALLGLAETNREAIIPAYTHLQRAQPVLLAHHLLAYFEMFDRDRQRFEDCLKRADMLPLGSGAGTGSPYPLDRDFVARELGFNQVSQNSLDAVSDRDFVIEYQAAASTTMMHLSRLAEEIVLWSSAEFGFLELDDAFATGSSLMPQKKNPDAAELARGKTGRVYGNLLGILTVMKGLPLAYNRDLQEDKEAFFDTTDTLLSTLEVFSAMLTGARFNPERARHAAEESHLLATDIADYLVKKDIPFRQAHEIVGGLVRYALEQGKGLQQLSLDEYQSFCPAFAEDIYLLTTESSLAARNIVGGTAPGQVDTQLARARRSIESGS